MKTLANKYEDYFDEIKFNILRRSVRNYIDYIEDTHWYIFEDGSEIGIPFSHTVRIKDNFDFIRNKEEKAS
jgi:hypothetical protein